MPFLKHKKSKSPYCTLHGFIHKNLYRIYQETPGADKHIKQGSKIHVIYTKMSGLAIYKQQTYLERSLGKNII